MAKLIPGKVRSQGSLLYEAGKVSLQEVKEKILYTSSSCGSFFEE